MNPIKVILILAFVTLLLWAFRNRRRVGLRAGARVLSVALTAAAIISIAQPSITSRIANLVGVTRGTDLVLYILVVVFMATTAGMYFRFKDLEHKLVAVSREIAILGAQVPEHSVDTEGLENVIELPTETSQSSTQERQTRTGSGDA